MVFYKSTLFLQVTVFVDYLKDSGDQNIIKCDVLKAPHNAVDITLSSF